LRLGQFDAAIADDDAALKLRPRIAEALYSRGLARRSKGDAAGAADDIAAAKAIQPDIADKFACDGVQ
jgi:tetratricopeptide (TPR) repeat protein